MNLDDAVVRRKVLFLAAVAAVATLSTWLTYLVFVRTARGQRFDDVAFRGRDAASPATTDATNRLLGTISIASLVLLGGALVLVAVARGRWRLAGTVGAAMVGAVVTTELLKEHVLERPIFPGIPDIAGNSFPSGHATIGMSLALGLVLVAPRPTRWITTSSAAVVAAGFGVAVLTSGWHRPSDTFGSYLVTTAWFAAATAVLLAWRGRDESHPRRSRSGPGSPWPILSIGALVLAALVYALVVSVRTDELRSVPFGRTYLLVTAGIAATSVMIVVGYHLVLRDATPDPPRRSGRQAPS